MTDIPICGFGLAADGFCREPREGDRCPRHSGLVCSGCRRNEATHECHHADGAVLCEACGHISAGQHSPKIDPRTVVENEFDRAIELILEDLNASEVLPSTQVQRRDAANAIRRGLTMHAGLKLLTGLARSESETS